MKVQVILPLLIIHVKMRFTVELIWNTEIVSVTCCKGDNQLLLWNFTKEENERITAYHWFFNEKTLICLDSETIGFHVANLYIGRVDRNGTSGILLKNVSVNDAGEYTLYVKLDHEKQRNVQGISLTVVDHLPYQCQPIITRHSSSVIFCSSSCKRSSLSPEWTINGTQDTVGIGPYLNVDSHWTSEHLFCCLRSLTCHNDDQFKLCTPNNISFADTFHINNQIGISTEKDTRHNSTVIVVIISVVMAVGLLVLIDIVVIYYRKRRYKSCRTLSDGNQRVNNVNTNLNLLEPFRSPATKDISDTDSHYEDALSELTTYNGSCS